MPSSFNKTNAHVIFLPLFELSKDTSHQLHLPMEFNRHNSEMKFWSDYEAIHSRADAKAVALHVVWSQPRDQIHLLTAPPTKQDSRRKD